MSWDELKQLMIKDYCSCEEMQKLDQKLWNRMIREVDTATYASRFNDLVTLCPGMVYPEEKKIERYIWGLPQPFQGVFRASKPATCDISNRLSFSMTHQEVH